MYFNEAMQKSATDLFLWKFCDFLLKRKGESTAISLMLTNLKTGKEAIQRETIEKRAFYQKDIVKLEFTLFQHLILPPIIRYIEVLVLYTPPS